MVTYDVFQSSGFFSNFSSDFKLKLFTKLKDFLLNSSQPISSYLRLI